MGFSVLPSYAEFSAVCYDAQNIWKAFILCSQWNFKEVDVSLELPAFSMVSGCWQLDVLFLYLSNPTSVLAVWNFLVHLVLTWLETFEPSRASLSKWAQLCVSLRIQREGLEWKLPERHQLDLPFSRFAYGCSTLTATSWNNSMEGSILSQALFVVMLPKIHDFLLKDEPGSRWWPSTPNNCPGH